MKDNIKLKRIIAALLTATLIGGTAGIAAYAENASDNKKTETASDEKIQLIAEKEETDCEKDETVYVFLSPDGGVNKVLVSDWLKNNSGAAEISDKSDLTGIENVKGDESFSQNGDTVAWSANGGDIYYTGESSKELPISFKVTYTLNGVDVSAKELVGKSGKLKIRFDYINNKYETKDIGGKNEKIYVPFAVLTGMVLDNDVFENVEVTNGKAMNDGDRTAVVLTAFPGLKESLNIDEDKLDIPEYAEITADVKDFEMTNTFTVATNEIFSRINTEKLDSTDDITEQLTKLTDAMTQLEDGSDALYDGLCTLLDKSGELTDGVNKLYDGAETLENGVKTLDDGAKTLEDGTAQLADGLTQLDANSDAINSGAAQVFQSLLSTADSQLAAAGLSVDKLTVSNYSTVLNNVIASLDESSVSAQAQSVAESTVKEAVLAQREQVEAAVTAAVKEQVSAQVKAAVRSGVEDKVLAAMGMTRDAYEAGVKAGAVSAEVQAQFAAAVDAQMNTDDVKALVEANTENQMATDEVKAIIASNTEEQINTLVETNMQSDEVQSQISAAVEKAKQGVESIAYLKAQLDSYNQFYSGVLAYTAGVSSAKNGADQLKDGTVQLSDGVSALESGAGELKNGIGSLKDSIPTLIDGIEQLRDGSKELSDGIKEFDEEGVKKIVDALDGDLTTLADRLRAVSEVSRDYNSYSSLADGMNGDVKFIYRTDSVE